MCKTNRDEAREIVKKLGYGLDKRIPVKSSVRNLSVYRDLAAILIDQLKEIYIDGELETVETANWVPKLIRKDFKVGLNVLGTAVNDPDVYFLQNYVCSSARTIPAIVIRALTMWSICNRWRRIRRDAKSWAGITNCSRI